MKSRLSTCITAIVLFAAFEAQAAAQTFTTLHSFENSTDGVGPSALIQATDGDLYGATSFGGVHDSGTIFKITPSGTLTTLHSFGSTDGSGPNGLIQATDGNFYGTTSRGGVYDAGTVFKITSSGTLTTLHSFDSTDGSGPSALIQATDGNFYGTTSRGGVYGAGTVFKITSSGVLTTLHSFDFDADGFFPNGPLIQAAGGNLFGTTLLGGTNEHCLYQGEAVFGCGTVFTMTRSGSLTRLYSFCLHSLNGCTDGARPDAALLQATDGNLYGTTWGGGPNSAFCDVGCGTIFKITPSGTLTTLHSFDSTDGANPSTPLVQDTNGDFYGTTSGGGAYNSGTIFKLSVGRGPFVETEPTSGKVGAAIKILGTNLTGATKVAFNGIAATFNVVSSSEIRTTIPAGATTGFVTVTASSGTLKSNQIFHVTPQITTFAPELRPTLDEPWLGVLPRASIRFGVEGGDQNAHPASQ